MLSNDDVSTSRDPRRCCEAVRSTILARAWLLVLYKSVDSYPFILYTVMFPGLVDLNYSEFFDEQNYEIIQIIQNTPWKCPQQILLQTVCYRYKV